MPNNLLSQDEIDSVLQQAQNAVAHLTESPAVGAAAGRPGTGTPSADRAPPTGPISTRLQRLLRLRVPLIVRLATRKVPVSEILKWDRGTIVEFDKTVGGSLDLMVNNHCIGYGEAVKVGENFGLRVARLVSPRKCIQSMARPH